MKMTGKDKGGAVIAAVAVISVVLLLSAAFATDPPEPEGEQVIHDYSVVYQPNGAKIDTGDNLVNAIALTGQYDGIISTEYNPEHWYDEDKQNLPRSTP